MRALAQAHLDALCAKLRALSQMQSALERLVASCHGDDDPNGAILAALAVHGPEAPTPGAVGAKPRRAAVGRPADAPRAAAARAAEPDTHHDLMAWTRVVHGGTGHH